MREKVLILTASDAGYFELLRGMLRSLRDKPEGREVPIAVFDVGLKPEQAQWCRDIGATLLRAEWDFEFPGRGNVGEAFKSLTARPFLPRYAPGHDIYLWLDADVWVQEWSAIELFLEGARRADIAVAPEIHRAFRHYYHAWAEFSGVNGAAYAEAFGREKADKLIRYPLINAGVFAMRADSAGWRIWEDTLREGIQRSTNMVDQIALNVAIYERGLKHEPLPSLCNWPVHHALPAWDQQRGLFVEPSLPHLPLGILHLTIYTKTTPSFEITQLDGTKRWMTVRYVTPGEDRTRPPTPGGFNP
jgi:hypothetical protein